MTSQPVWEWGCGAFIAYVRVAHSLPPCFLLVFQLLPRNPFSKQL